MIARPAQIQDSAGNLDRPASAVETDVDAQRPRAGLPESPEVDESSRRRGTAGISNLAPLHFPGGACLVIDHRAGGDEQTTAAVHDRTIVVEGTREAAVRAAANCHRASDRQTAVGRKRP